MGAGKIELLQEKSVLSQNPIKTENPCEFTFEFSHGTKEKHLIFGILTEFQVFLAHIFVKIGGGCGIRTHVGVNPNGFQDRLVMTASITLRI